MIKAKVLAMCVCPVIAAPPAIIAVHPPARHAIAHLLHRAARRLDPAPVVRSAPGPLPCAPSLAAGDGALPVVGGALLNGAPPVQLVSAPLGGGIGSLYPADLGPSGGGGGFYGGGAGLTGGGGVGGSVGSIGGAGPGGPQPGGSGSTTTPAGGTAPGTVGLPIGVPPVGIGPGGVLPPTGATAVSGAPEPSAWVFLVIGFGLVGAIARARPIGRRATGAAGED